MTKLIKLDADLFIVKDTQYDVYVRGTEDRARETLEGIGVFPTDIEQAFDIFDTTDDNHADFGIAGRLIYTTAMDSEDHRIYLYE